MATASGDPHDSAAAFFRPDDDKELIFKFLRTKMAGKPLPPAARFIHNADVFSITPGVLADTYLPAPGARPVWYFFSPVHYYCGMRHREVRAQHHRQRVLTAFEHMASKTGGTAHGWYRKLFRFVDAKAMLESPEARWLPPEWWMVEYGLTEEEADQQQLVLCALSRSP